MKQNLLTLFVILLTVTASAQSVKIFHYFKPGEKYQYEYIVKQKGGDPESAKVASTTLMSFSSDKEDMGGIHTTWTYGATSVTGMTEEQRKQVQPLLDVNKGFALKLTLDRDGNISAIENYDECGAHIDKVLKMVMGLYSELTGEQNAQIQAMVESSMNDPMVMLQTYFPQVYLYFNGYGESYTNGQYWMEESAKPFGLEDEMIPFLADIKVTQVPGTTLQLDIVENLDKEILQSAKEAFSGENKSWEKSLDFQQISKFTISQKMVYDPRSKVMQSYTLERKVEMPGNESIIKTEELKLKKS
jgi:hypothetical protein